jgi:hypothetical protein
MRSAVPFLLAATFGVCGVASAAQGQLWTAAPDAQLEKMRGGFALAPDLMVSFGIVRTVRIDGAVVAHTALQIEDMRTITLTQSRQLGDATRGITVQNGAGNTANVGGLPLPAIVIQNTESNRQLQAVTEITAATNSLRLSHALQWNRTLSDALAGGIGR